MEKLLVSVVGSIFIWVMISLVVSFFRSRKHGRPASGPINNPHLDQTRTQKEQATNRVSYLHKPVANSRKEEVADKAVAAAHAMGAKNARECAEIVRGAPLSESDWKKVEADWEGAWHRVEQQKSNTLNETPDASETDPYLQEAAASLEKLRPVIAQAVAYARFDCGARSAREAAEIALRKDGSTLTEENWQLAGSLWEEEWHALASYSNADDFRMQIKTFLLARVKHGAQTAKEAAYIAAGEYSNSPMTEEEWNMRRTHYERLWQAVLSQES